MFFLRCTQDRLAIFVQISVLKKLKIFTRLFLTHTAIGLVSVVSLSVIFYFLLLNALIERTSDQLSSINILKKNTIEEYFNETQKNLELHFGQKKIKAKNLSSLKDELSIVRQLYNFKSIVVFDAQWKKIITTSSDSLLMEVMSSLSQKQKTVKKFQLIEAVTFVPVHNTIIVYVMSVSDGDGVSGYIFIEDDFNTIQKILQETTGMGNTGESYLVGNDLRMRSRSRFNPSQPPLLIEVNTDAARGAFLGSNKSAIILDYRGVKVLTVSRKITSPYLQWALISEIDFEEAMMPMVKGRNYIILATVLIIIVIIAITLFISNAISKPILHLKKIIIQLSRGEIPAIAAKLDDGSELGQIAQAIDELVIGLKQTTQFADQIGAGEFNAPYTALSDKDTLGYALIHMRDKLKSLSEEQVRLIREKASALLEGQENERKRIVRDLHDGVGQLLTGIRLRVQMLEHEEQLRNEIMRLINETIAEVKRVSYNVMPNAIVDFGLEAALRGLCDNVRKYASMNIDFNYVKEFDHALSFDVSIAVFRIVQEGFNNIMKHSGGTHADLLVLDREHQLYLLLKDNGSGFIEGSTNSGAGFGLRNMKERAKLLNGNLEIHSMEGQGTTIEVTIPLT